ncbi:CHAT domain-containing protein [Nitrosospira briensis]|uniref:CHAT domain-containing protein n=1 Tax=Nitrosospira briensis TaxID=35799 RepID=UPI00069EE40D|nr:CHAT domain-containing tetratricopeptide repeat protein [Nitrosospira briensis]
MKHIVRGPIITLLLMMSLSPASAYSGAKDDATQLNQQALALYQQSKYEEALPLYQRILALQEETIGLEHAETARTLNSLAKLYQAIDQYDRALPLYQRSLTIREKILGSEHPDTATSLNGLASLYATIDQYDKALPLYQRALAIREKVLGPEHSDTAQSLNNLGVLFRTIDQYDKALPLYQRALAIREKVLGPEHSDTAQSLNNLAVLYQTLGENDKALPLYQRALEIREKALGPEHIETASSLNNLAVLYRSIDQYDKALPLYQRALAIREKVLGSGHTATATSLNSLAALYGTLGEYDKAMPLYQRALEVREKALGPEHTETATSLNNLAALYDTLGEYDKAMPLYQRALEVREKALGPKHIETATSLNNLAALYDTLGEYDKAMPLYQRALKIREEILGSEHIDTANSMDILAVLNQKLSAYDKALPLYERALAIREKFLGLNHVDTAGSLNNLAALYRILGEYHKAMPLYQRALVIREKALGPEHTDTASSLNNLAVLYNTLDEYDRALPLLQRALAIREKVLGPEHTDTASSLNNLAVLYNTLDEYDRALPLLQHALAIREKVLGPEHPETAASLNNLAALYDSLGEYDKAMPLYRRAYYSAQSARVPETLKLVQRDIGYFYAKHGDSAAAIFYLKAAVNTMQTIRGQSLGLDMVLQKSLLSKNKEVYKQLADLLIVAGRLTEAQEVLSILKEDEYFDFIQRDIKADPRSTRISYNQTEKLIAEHIEKLGNESAILVDQLNTLNKKIEPGLTSQIEQQRKRIKQQLAAQAKNMVSLHNAVPKQLETAKKQVRMAIDKQIPSQLRELLTSLGNGVVLLQYLVTDTHIRIILTTPQMQFARNTKIQEKELNRKIAEFGRIIENPALDPRPLAQALYQLLIAPIAQDLERANAQMLMLSLDDSLRYLPISALHDGKAYLTERYPVVMYSELAKAKLRDKPSTRWRAAGFGITQATGLFKILPAVRQELDGIIYVGVRKTIDGVLPGKIYLDKEFTEARLRNVLEQDYPILHIASHFVFIPGTVSKSFLLLGDGKQLSLDELRSGGWKFDSIDMMTLSACETGLGGAQDGSGDEIEGFGALAQRQGAKSVLATLWKVADRSTAIFMQALYHLRQEKGFNKANALREAQLTLIYGKHPLPTFSHIPRKAETRVNITSAPIYVPDPAKPYAHPFFWAPFILMGNWL